MIKTIVILIVLLMLVDIPMVLYLYQTTYLGMFDRINNRSNINQTRLYIAGFIVYSLMALGLYVFVILPSVDVSFFTTIMRGALLGAILFGVHNLTNVATIPEFGIKESAIDTIWGGTLFAVVTALYISVNTI